MKQLIVILVLVLLGGGAFAQTEPNWLWSRRAGSAEEDLGASISTDGLGNIYVTGLFAGTVAFGGYTLTSAGATDVFVAKLDTDGNWLWAKRAGGPEFERGCGIRTSSAGISNITGYFQSNADFGPTTLSSSGEGDIYVAKLDADGNWFWAISAGGTLHDQGNSISVDSGGNCFVTGLFQSVAQFGVFQATSAGNRDIFIAKIDPDGNWTWIRRAGGIGDDRGYGIGTDDQGNSYATGYFATSTLFGTITLTNGGVFAVKLDPNGNWLWARKADGNNYAAGSGINTSGDGLCRITGHFEASVSFGADTIDSQGDRDAFVAALDSNGTWLWASSGGGSSYDAGFGITADAGGNSYICGRFQGTVSFGSTTLTTAGESDIFAGCLNPDGNWLWAVRAGGGYYDYANSVVTDVGGSLFFAGEFWNSADFGPNSLVSNGYNDLVVAKLGSGVATDDLVQPGLCGFQLTNYPNPFNPQTTLAYSLPAAGPVLLEIYNSRGQLVRCLQRQEQSAGRNTLVWNGKDDSGRELGSGVYLCRVAGKGGGAVRKLLLLK